jgi:thiamine-phosphate pyrophosphorylase
LPSDPDRAIVWYVTDGRAFAGPDRDLLLIESVRKAVSAGVDGVQVREKDLPARRLLTLVRQAVKLSSTRGARSRVLVNDRLDVALAAGAAGVHLAEESAPASAMIQWCRAGNAPPTFSVGVSCHGLEGVRSAESAGADYVFFGAVFDTPSKRAFGEPQGIARLAEICRLVRIPVIAIGGINESSAADCIQAGAKGVAAIRPFQEPRDGAALARFVSAVHGCR